MSTSISLSCDEPIRLIKPASDDESLAIVQGRETIYLHGSTAEIRRLVVRLYAVLPAQPAVELIQSAPELS